MRRAVIILIPLSIITLIAITTRAAPPAPITAPAAATTPTRAIYAPLIANPAPPTATATVPVVPTTTPTEIPGLPQFVNGTFEQGHAGWTEIPGNGIITQFPPAVTPHAGQWLAWLGGENGSSDELQQAITLPAGKPLYLHYYYQIRSQDVDPIDTFQVLANTTVLQDITLWDLEDTGGQWVEDVIDLNAYAGQTVTIRFLVRSDTVDPSSVFVDDIRISSHP